MARDHYETLGVSKSATAEEITKAYKKLARQHHPDRNLGDKSAEAKFKEIQSAYDTLNDPKKKSNYDQFGTDQPMPEGGPGGFHFGGGQPGGMNIDPEMFQDLLGRFTGGGRRGRKKQPPPDLEAEARIPLATAASGGTVSMRLDSKTIDVKIPAGIEEGKKLRIPGQGPGGSDITVKILFDDHPFFRREGRDIYLDVPISIPEAIQGCKIEVPTVAGKRATVKIAPGTSGGTKLRLGGQGLPGGDQYLVFKVSVPKHADERTMKLVEEFRKLHPEDPRADAPWR